MIEWKIKKKYFDAILKLEKPFELRHKPIKEGSIVKLIEIEKTTPIYNGENIEKWEKICSNDKNYIKPSGRYIIFRSGECKEIIPHQENDRHDIEVIGRYWCFTDVRAYINIMEFYWFDKFCWDYINEKQTYLIEIAEILEVK